jgi:predicted P-loop ATPase
VGHEYDAQCSDYTRLCGLAHDPEVYVNWEAEPFVITDDEILAANFSADKERGKPRREYAAGTHSVSVEDAWQNVEKTLAGRGLVYQSGHHHDYVMHAAFLMNRYGVDLDELLQWASQVWSDYNNKERENTIRSCYKKTQEHGTWRLNRAGRKSKETSMITLPEIKDWLRQHAEVIYNVVTDQLMYKAGGEAFGLLDERVVCSIRSQMAADTGKRVLKNDVMDVLRSDFARLYHPVREYIESLPAWDGRDRVKELCSHVIESEEFPYSTLCQPSREVENSSFFILHSSLFGWALHKWLVACVASWMSDLSSNHEIFVLIGAQGIYKTTFFRHLLPPQLRMYFWENAHNSFASKDDHLALAENCLVEIEEIDLQNPRDISELKALATSEKVKERRPYARFREEKHRLASFCGSGNQQHFLSDDTGNRRWLCFKVNHIDDPRTWALDYDQLYAQLRDELRQGFRYWFDPDEQRIVEQQNQAFRIESDEEQLIRSRLRPPRTTDKITLMNAASICQFINGGVVGRGLSSRKVSLAMTKLGFKRVRTNQGAFYEVYQIPPNEIQPTLAITDNETVDSQADTSWHEQPLPF